MDMLLELSLYLVLVFFVLAFGVKHWRKIKVLSGVDLFVALYFILMLFVISLYPLLGLGRIGSDKFYNLNYASIVSLFAVIQGMVAFICTRHLDKKKLRTLFKLPVIAFLAGLFFGAQYIPILCLGFYGITVILLYSRGERVRYLFMKVLKFVPIILIMSFFSLTSNYTIYTILILLVIASSSLMDLLHINSLFKKEEV